MVVLGYPQKLKPDNLPQVCRSVVTVLYNDKVHQRENNYISNSLHTRHNLAL